MALPDYCTQLMSYVMIPAKVIAGGSMQICNPGYTIQYNPRGHDLHGVFGNFLGFNSKISACS